MEDFHYILTTVTHVRLSQALLDLIRKKKKRFGAYQALASYRNYYT